MKRKNQIMKIIAVFIALFSFTFAPSCKSKIKEEGITTINVTKSYSEKTIELKDISDLEYVIMDDSDDFLYKGRPLYITDNTVVIEDFTTDDFLFFTREGKPKSRFNKKGGGPNEFSDISASIYDENKDELFIVSRDRVLVYSSEGEFIRKFPLVEGAYVTTVRDFDEECLIIYDRSESYDTDFLLISKEDGRVIDLIDLPRSEKVQLYLVEMDGNNINITTGTTNNLVPHKEGFLLTNYSSDTVYSFNRNKELEPFLVRTPEIQKMEPIIYLNSLVESSQYQFMLVTTVKKQNNRLPSVSIVRDKSNNRIYKQNVVLSEFEGKEIVITPACLYNMKDADVGFFEFNMDELQTANNENRLSGELKKITEHAESINNSNNIYMLVHFK